MVEKIQFQFDDKLDYQLDAINSVVRLFNDLPQNASGIYEPISRAIAHIEHNPVRNIEITAGSRLLENLRAVQLANNLYADCKLEGNNFTVEMETGTGKTYVYLRTILELYKEYGFKKFMIVVPSIAIRMGVEKSIEQLREHFKAIYDVDLGKHSFVYGGNLPQVSDSFVEAVDLAVCILNIQAFNKDGNKIRTPDAQGKVLWEDIKYIRPIVVIDEPQKIEGGRGARARTRSLQAIEELSPLFTLRYSATHRRFYNQVYKLNSYEAYKKELVKHIAVKTVNGVIPKEFPYVRYLGFTNDLYARIEIFSQKQGHAIKFETYKVRGNASLYDLSGGLPQYANFRIAEDPHKLKPLKIDTQNSFFELSIGHSNYNAMTENEAIRIQIRLAIENHFKKQEEILDLGRQIKVLTLFFVDSVSKVRDASREDGRGEYLRIFDEEYKKILSGQSTKKMFEKYSGQLNLFVSDDQISKVREGYFARDKNQKEVEVEGWDASLADEDVKVNAKSQEEINRGIDLILRKKDELISFKEPLAFIFSHSALREGWDNPNVFTICTLKRGGNEIAKKQEIGRGLRLPVDTNGVRCTDTNINELTVIANDNFAHFAESLQKDFNDSMNFKKDEVTADILSQTLVKAGVPLGKIQPALIEKLREELFCAGIINDKDILTKDAQEIARDISFDDPTLCEHSVKIMEAFKECMVEKGSTKIDIRNADNEPLENGPHCYLNEEHFFSIFRNLSEKLSKRTIYKLSLDKDSFISECVEEINEILLHRKVKTVYEIDAARIEAKNSGRFIIDRVKNDTLEKLLEDDIVPKSDFEIANIIMYHTNLPRLAIFRILNGIEKKKLLSNQDILDIVVENIKTKLNDAKAKSINDYEVINGYEFDDKVIFEADKIDEEMFATEKRVYETKESAHRALNKYYRMDSEGEFDFAENLEQDPNVLLFTKIKKGGFVIDTPYGNYSPDWAVVYKQGEGDVKLYFIVETKFAKDWKDLTGVEKLKIKCGKLHFRAVAATTNDAVRFDWAKGYQDFKDKLMV